jgi:hypothetical protein
MLIVLSLLVVVALCLLISTASAITTAFVPEVSYAKLISLEPSTVSALRSGLLDAGIVAVADIPHYDVEVETTLNALQSRCRHVKVDEALTSMKSSADSCANNVPASGLRPIVHGVARQLLAALVDDDSNEVQSRDLFGIPSAESAWEVDASGENMERIVGWEQQVTAAEQFDSGLFTLVSTHSSSDTSNNMVHVRGCGAQSDLRLPSTSGLLVVMSKQGHKWLSSRLRKGIAPTTCDTSVPELFTTVATGVSSGKSAPISTQFYARQYFYTSSGADTTVGMDSGDSGSKPFCSSMGMTMSMSGFFTTNSKDAICINLFLESATLDTQGKFAAGCLGVFLMGILIQLLSRVRIEATAKYKKTRVLLKQVINFFTFGIQATMGYLLMLAAMTYNVELFLMVVFGLIAGYAMFHLNLPPPVTTDPCCDAENELVVNKMHSDGVDHMN